MAYESATSAANACVYSDDAPYSLLYYTLFSEHLPAFAMAENLTNRRPYGKSHMQPK